MKIEKIHSLIASAIFCLLPVTALAAADTARPSAEPADASSPDEQVSVTGEIVSVTNVSFEIKEQQSGETVTVRLDEETEITVDGESGEPNDLEVGMAVGARVEEVDGHRIARFVYARKVLTGA